MIIKRRGWIGGDRSIDSIRKELEVLSQCDLKIVIDPRKKRGKPKDWKDHQWPPRSIEVTIEVKEVPLCAFCDKPHGGEMRIVANAPGMVHAECVKRREADKKKRCAECGGPVEGVMQGGYTWRAKDDSYVHWDCERARKVEEFYQEMERVPDLLKKKIEKIEEYNHGLQVGDYNPRNPGTIEFHDMIGDITKKINELIDRVNGKKGRPVCPICKYPILVDEANFFGNGEFFHTICRRRRKK